MVAGYWRCIAGRWDCIISDGQEKCKVTILQSGIHITYLPPYVTTASPNPLTFILQNTCMNNKEIENLNMPALQFYKQAEPNPEGYPLYPVSDDIYNQSKEEPSIDPEDITRSKDHNKPGKKNEKDFEEDVSGSDLDVPGSEDDDAEENVGSEDEENNHYSLGGDEMNDLEEDHGE
jgi:hypothetical protein